MMKYILTIFFFCLIKFSFSQDLINNGDFEIYTNCPSDFSELTKIPGWKQNITSKFSNYVNTCNKDSKVFKGYGFVEPYSGNGCAGFINIEGIATALSKPLIKDSTYIIDAYVILSAKSNYAEKSLGLIITDTSKIKRYDKSNSSSLEWYDYYPDVIFSSSSKILIDKKKWTKIVALYTAKGGENFIHIGGFFLKDSLGGQISNKVYFNISDRYDVDKNNLCFYYIDSVSVRPYKMKIILDKPVILETLLFKFDSASLLRTSFPELDYLSQYLNQHKKLNIKVSGYTDNVGQEEYNLLLSQKRADVVKKYFIDKGIASERIISKGYGSINPISTNDTEDGRSKNRRIEVKFE